MGKAQPIQTRGKIIKKLQDQIDELYSVKGNENSTVFYGGGRNQNGVSSSNTKPEIAVTPLDQEPTVPINVRMSGHTPNSFVVEWNDPTVADDNVLFEIKYSKSPRRNGDGSPYTAIATLSGLAGNSKTIAGLDSNSVYYVWMRSVDGGGMSSWVGGYQTDTDPNIPTAASLDFKVIPGYLSNFLNWKQPSGRNLKFSVMRIDSDGSETIIIKKTSLLTKTDSKNIEPATSYTYYLDVYDETGSLLRLNPTIQIKTLNIPPPTRIIISTTGTNIHANIEIPPFIKTVNVELSQYDLKNVDGSFSERPVLRRLTRLLSDPQNTPITKTFTKEQLNTSTLYYVHARSNHLDKYFSSWSPDKSITTGRYLAPYDVSSLSIKVPSRGKVTMKWRSRGDYRGETFIITRYQQGKLGSVIVGSSIRDADPRDKDNRSNRVEISFTGQPTSGTWVYVVTPVNDTGVGGSDTYTINFR